jgi:hypothetical protein
LWFHLFSPAARADDMKNSKLLLGLEAIGEANVCDEGASVQNFWYVGGKNSEILIP